METTDIGHVLGASSFALVFALPEKHVNNVAASKEMGLVLQAVFQAS